MTFQQGKQIKDFSVSILGLLYRLVIDGGIHIGCCGAYKARLRVGPADPVAGLGLAQSHVETLTCVEGGIGR